MRRLLPTYSPFLKAIPHGTAHIGLPRGAAPRVRGRRRAGRQHLARQLQGDVAQLELTTLKSLDSFEVAKDTLAQPNVGSAELFDAALTLLRQASEKKVKPDEVRSWASKALKAAEAHGHRWQLDMAVQIAETLA